MNYLCICDSITQKLLDQLSLYFVRIKAIYLFYLFIYKWDVHFKNILQKTNDTKYKLIEYLTAEVLGHSSLVLMDHNLRDFLCLSVTKEITLS